MKNTTNLATRILVLICASALSLTAAAASVSKQVSNKAGTQLAQSYTWYDGDREQTVWLNPQAVAEFNPGKAEASAVKSLVANAKMLPVSRTQGAVRMWQMDNTGDAAVRSLTTVNPAGKYSPVFHDSPNSSAAMRALPGNIIVYLNPAWDAATVANWVKTKKLEVVKKMEAGPNIFIFKTASGLEALNTANALYLSGEVVAAFPDWWQEVSTR